MGLYLLKVRLNDDRLFVKRGSEWEGKLSEDVHQKCPKEDEEGISPGEGVSQNHGGGSGMRARQRRENGKALQV